MNAQTLDIPHTGITLDPQISEIGERIKTPVNRIFFPTPQNDYRFRYLYPHAKIVSAKHAEDPSEDYDLVVLAREQAGKIRGKIFPHLKSGGFVVTDNYYDMARALSSSRDLKLIGCSHEEKGWLSAKQCSDFLQEIDKDGDWIKTPDFATAERIRELVHRRYSGSF